MKKEFKDIHENLVKRRERGKFITLPRIVGTIITIGTIGTASFLHGHLENSKMYFLRNPERENTYTVKKGDNLWEIASDIRKKHECLDGYDTRDLVKALGEFNPDLSPKKLPIGIDLQLPEYNCN